MKGFSYIKSILLISFIGISSSKILGQGAPFCPSVNAQFGTGPSTTICMGNCATLASSVVPVNQTTTYSIQSIPYSPYSFTTGTSILANQDDIWSAVTNLGFNFCYFGSSYNQCIIGSNGQLCFGLGLAGGSDNWAISAALPNTIDMPGNTICAAFRDIDPTSSGNIYFTTYGTAPCRNLVISWSNVPMFSNPGSCTGIPNSTFQLVLNETTNYIDVYIQNSSTCPGWNAGAGIIGIQNLAGTLGYSPVGRNFPAAWTATNEAWRFVPTGPQSYTVTWSGPSGVLGTGLTQNVCPLATTNYTATMNVSGCAGVNSSYTSAVTVSVVPGPTLTVNSASICQGAAATLSVSGAATYTWNPGGSNATSVTFAPAATTIYTVLGSTGGACISFGTGTITVNPSPTANIVSNSPVCAGQAINFTGSGGTTYTWTGIGLASNTQNPIIPSSSLLNNSVYTLTVADANGCTNTTSQAVIVNALPFVSPNGSTVCANQTINLSAAGGTLYAWSGPLGFSSNLQNPTIPNSTVPMSGQYILTLTDINGCSNTGATNVLVSPIPTPSAFNSGAACVNDIITLSANGGSPYSWIGPNGFIAAIQNPTVNATLAGVGNYTVTVGPAGCSASAVTNLTVNPLPTASIISSINKGCVPLCVTFTCVGSANIQNYNWLTGDGAQYNGNTITNCYKSASNYTINTTVTDINGCIGSTNYFVDAYPIPVADFNYGPIRPVVNTDAEVTFTDASHEATIVSWNWYFMNTAQYQSTLQNPTFTYYDVGTYQILLVVKSNHGCSDTILKTVQVNEDFGIYVPISFTPNGDGLNDVFQPKGYGVTKYEFEIYDRWGEMLFHTNDFSTGWDGKAGGQLISDGIYTYRIRLSNVFGQNREFTGHVTLYK